MRSLVPKNCRLSSYRWNRLWGSMKRSGLSMHLTSSIGTGGQAPLFHLRTNVSDKLFSECQMARHHALPRFGSTDRGFRFASLWPLSLLPDTPCALMTALFVSLLRRRPQPMRLVLLYCVQMIPPKRVAPPTQLRPASSRRQTTDGETRIDDFLLTVHRLHWCHCTYGRRNKMTLLHYITS